MMHNPLFLETLTHLSRMLGIANRFIPIYKDIKPIAKQLPNFLSKLSTINSQIKEKSGNYINKISNIKENEKEINGPTFFK